MLSKRGQRTVNKILRRKQNGKRPIQSKRNRAPVGYTEEESRLWREIDGAIADAFFHHPYYLTPKGKAGHAARSSIAKRVIGAIRASRKRGADRVPTPAANKPE